MAAPSSQRFPLSAYGGRANLRCCGTVPAGTGRLPAADPVTASPVSRAEHGDCRDA